MSISAVLLDGARRAATYAAMLFSLNAPPAVAPPGPGAAADVAALAVDGSVAASGLTLVAHHLDVRVAGAAATVRSWMLLRNDRSTGLAVQYVLPQPACVVRGEPAAPAGAVDLAARCDDGDLSPEAAEQAEAAPGRRVHRYDVIVFAPGEQLGVAIRRELPVEVAGGVHRLRLPLPVDREAPWVPRFTADVLVEAAQPIRRLASPTHEALVDGLGERSALLSVPDGFVYRQGQLAVEFELGEAAPDRPLAALGQAPAGRPR